MTITPPEPSENAAPVARSVFAGVVAAILLLSIVAIAIWLQTLASTSFLPVFGALVLVIALATATGYFISPSSTILGFLTRCKQELDLLFPTPADEDDLLRDTRRTRDAFLSIVAVGVAAMFLYALQWTPAGFAHVFGGSILLAVAAFTTGICAGFLFGIPRTLQSDRAAAQAASAAATNSSASAPAPVTAQLSPNTNLEQISDWLTKIIVGLGLINLDELPDKYMQVAAAAASITGGSRAVAAVIIAAFGVCGFMQGYLLTRLYLTRAFVRARARTGNGGDHAP